MPSFIYRTLFAAASALLLFSCTLSRERYRSLPALPAVPNLDLARYMGVWYEIALLPNQFEKGCTGSKAEYSLNKDDTVRVENSCRDKTLEGDLRKAVGKAWAASKETNAKLRVSFFCPFDLCLFAGDYWVLALDPDYQWALIGEPSRRYLWILSRTSKLSDSIVAELKERAAGMGFNADKIKMTVQP